ncbi:DJ-1/PfpI/YhbO family deglycase/protease [Altererythrobacter aurantiacus]|uniref:DJ-1/PfpI/YhbO family deglycase/protease n=1 Tax=Parapontixanthobacter aurantiacus TaxID=1463599 RepID=A0A844ZA52_9SPHN|nr:type 1 glutamine amidotransferase domain-containing protein [Parapontixanthobacter aurantiacus]MXO84785.1 DJ-1/PfpI/YhbO family deglycase/protease [Parapontixanthobacter aurantiacus]
MTKKVMILATNGFEQSELMKPKANLEDAGIETTVVSLEKGSIKGWDKDDWGESVSVDKTVDEIENCEGYDALLLPGGQINPDLLRVNERAVAIVKEFNMAGKPIAAICHAPWLLIEAGIVEGKTATSYHSIRTDLKNAGANVVDQEVATDGNIITSRNPDDIPAFSKELISRLQEEKVGEPA